MGLFNKKGKGEDTEKAKGEPEQPATTTQSRKSRGLLRRRSKGENREDGEDLSPEADTGSQSKSKGWLSRKSKDEALPPPPPQPTARTSADQSTPAAKKSTKRNWIGRKQKNGTSEDDTALNQAELVQEEPKPPPRIRTPEEIAAGLERQKEAVNAVRNTPEKRAATRAAAPVEIPPATTSNAYSTAPVDRSGANRAAGDRSGGKFKGMFKGKGPSIPGFKSKRNSGSPADNAVVSSAPVEVIPDVNGNSTDGTGANSSALAPDTKKGGKFKGMFKRSSGKAKIASPARDLPARNGVGQAGAPHEVELSDQAELSDEPVLTDDSAASYSEHAPAQHMQPQQQLPAGYSGIATQEYAPVLPQNNNGMGGRQPESNGYADMNQAGGQYQGNRNAYDREEEQRDGRYHPEGESSHNAQRGTGRHDYPNGGNSYHSAGRGQTHSYRQQAGQYQDDVGQSQDDAGQYYDDSDGEEYDGAGQLDSGEWDRVNRTWNKT